MSFLLTYTQLSTVANLSVCWRSCINFPNLGESLLKHFALITQSSCCFAEAEIDLEILVPVKPNKNVENKTYIHPYFSSILDR